MAQDDGSITHRLTPAVTEPAEIQVDDPHRAQSYRPPQLFAIGKAVDLVQSGTGKHVDDYSGWYWSQEG